MSNVPKSIEAHFYEKLVNSALFGEPKEGLLDSLKERISVGTDEQFDRAAEIIIRERKSGAFPALAVCLQAIERACREPFRQAQGRGAVDRDAITKGNFHAACKALGRCLVIRSDEPIRWTAWRRYYKSLGLTWSFKEMARPDRRDWTVPTEMPSQFDPRWVDTDPTDSRFSQRDYASPEERRLMADNLLDQLPTGLRPPRKNYGGTSTEELRAMDEAKSKSRYDGLAFSDELSRILQTGDSA